MERSPSATPSPNSTRAEKRRSSSKPKRERSSNLTNKERHYIANMVESPRFRFLLDKRVNKEINLKKRKGWAEIAKEFTRKFNNLRNGEQILNAYKNAIRYNLLNRERLDKGNYDDLGLQVKQEQETAVFEIQPVSTEQHDQLPKYICFLCQTRLENASLLKYTALSSVHKFLSPEHVYEIRLVPEVDEIEIEVDEHKDIPDVAEEAVVNEINCARSPKATHEEEEASEQAQNDNEVDEMTQSSEESGAEENAVSFLIKSVETKRNAAKQLEDEEGKEKGKPGPQPGRKRAAANDRSKLKVDPLSLDDSPEYQKRKHVCDACSKRFLRRSNLIDHLKMHANIRSFVCETCNRSFIQAANYRAHLRIHLNERNYKCKLCPASFIQSGALRIHVRGHTQEKNYVCQFKNGEEPCTRAFTNASDLRKHEKIHLDIREFVCGYPGCGQEFRQKTHIKRHIFRHHKDAPIEATILKKGENVPNSIKREK